MYQLVQWVPLAARQTLEVLELTSESKYNNIIIENFFVTDTTVMGRFIFTPISHKKN